eukprot:scaffold3207_cov112-Isochrysis_galbana.AAC.2
MLAMFERAATNDRPPNRTSDAIQRAARVPPRAPSAAPAVTTEATPRGTVPAHACDSDAAHMPGATAQAAVP